MNSVLSMRNMSLVVVAFLLAAATLATSAVFTADQPEADLSPVGNSDELVRILQGNRTILWTSLAGSVSSYTVQGWPTFDGDSELGGALMIKRPENGLAGVIDFGEKPMSLSFQIND